MNMQISLLMVLQKECYDCHNFGDEWGDKFYDLKLDDKNEIYPFITVQMPVDTSLIEAMNIAANDPDHPACVAFDSMIGDKESSDTAKIYFILGWIKSKIPNINQVAKDAWYAASAFYRGGGETPFDAWLAEYIKTITL